MKKPACEESAYYGHRAVTLRSGPYEAVLLPGLGGNLISFVDLVKGYRFIRSPRPDQMDEFVERPARFGIPVLFPPNRIDGGRFDFAGRRYQFPVNEVSLNNHIHGLFVRAEWMVVDHGISHGNAFVEIAQQVNEGHPAYEVFPFRFNVRLRYTLSENGLEQQISIYNFGEQSMPCMLGFHTGFFAPFCERSAKEDYTFNVSIGQRWAVNDRMLPTGELLELTGADARLTGEGESPFAKSWADYYTASPINGCNRMELTDHNERVKLVYKADLSYRNWVLWNDQASGDFICVEPQTCTVNAINLHLPPDESGLIVLEPKQTWKATSLLYAESLN